MKKLALTLLFINAVLLAGRFWQELPVGAESGRGGDAALNGDVNGDASRDVSDAVYLLRFLFQGGPEPVAIAAPGDLEDRVAVLEDAVVSLENSLPASSDPVAAAASRLAHLLDPATPDDPLPPGTLQRVDCPDPERPILDLTIKGESLGRVVGFTGYEAISSPYTYSVAVQTPDPGLETENVLGAPGKLTFVRGERTSVFSGVVSECTLASYDRQTAVYIVRLVPPLHGLSRHVGYRAFQESGTVPDIVAQVMADRGLSGPMDRLDGDYPMRPFELQYRESELDFVSRLLEEEGIFYFFEHSGEGEMMVVADVNSAFPEAGNILLTYRGHEAAPRVGEELVRTFRAPKESPVGRVTLRDYDFERPTVNLSASAVVEGGDGEQYEYGPMSTQAAVLNRLAAARLERRVLEPRLSDGTSNAGQLRAGIRFRLTDATGAGFGGDYIVTAVRHVAVLAEVDGKSCVYYGNAFTALPDTLRYRPARRTPVPVVSGPQSAVVVGPAGEETFTDEYGRVKVQFHWDRQGAHDEQSSAWLRVATFFAGAQRGAFFLPEVEDEVLVAFQHGDPRRPVVIGSLYNGDRLPPVSQPENKDVPLLRSRSGHQLVFDDRAGQKAVILSSEGGQEVMLDDAAGSRKISLTSSAGNVEVRSGLDMQLESGAALALRSGSDATLQASTLALEVSQTTVAGRLVSRTDAGARTRVAAGERYRDNSIVAWASVDPHGSVRNNEFGVASVKYLGLGQYKVALDVEAASGIQLIPMAVAIVSGPPVKTEDLRFVTVQPDGPDAFIVYTNNPSGLVDNAFLFLATARPAAK